MNQNILQNVPLADKNWFQTGGSARFFSEPISSKQFKESLEFAKNNNLEIFILGHGANILISDSGFDGLVIRPKLNNIELSDIDSEFAFVTAQAGVVFSDLIEYCLKNNLSGLEEFSGIPGTVGGSVFINIHYFEFLLSNFLISAKVINRSTGEILSVSNDWFNFGYNYCVLHEKNYYLIEATFKLKKIDEQTKYFLKGRRYEMMRYRSSRYPNSNTCGSFFRNFFENEVTIISNNKKMIYVAYYLDKIGVKGQLCFGGASVSYQHANMLVTRPGATSNDVVCVARKMQELVKDKFGIIPVPECQLIGFKEYPFLQAF